MDKIDPPRHSSQPPRRYKNINTDITLKCGPAISMLWEKQQSHKDEQSNLQRRHTREHVFHATLKYNCWAVEYRQLDM